MTKKTYIRGTLKLVIDTEDADTPAMVYAKREALSSSYDCATSEGFIDGEYELSPIEIDWLECHRDKVERAFTIARANHPEYN